MTLRVLAVVTGVALMIFATETNFFALNSLSDMDSRSSLNTPGPAAADQTGSKAGNSANSASLLYSSKGHNHLPSEFLIEERLAPLTRWTQSYIFKHQFVADCSKARILICDGWPQGIGSEMHVMGTVLAYAIENNFTMVLSPQTCKFFTNAAICDKGCGCVFQPISNCEYNDAIMRDPNLPRVKGHKVNSSYLANLIPTVFRSALLSKIPSMTAQQIKYWWRAQSAAFLMRFNNETVRAVSNLRHNQSLHYFTGGSTLPFPLPSGTISAHIRGGDKKKEMKLVAPARYVEAATELIQRMPNSFSSRTLFVSGDEERAIQESRVLAEKERLPFVYTHIHRQIGGYHLRNWTSKDDVTANFYGHLLQLLMCLEADAWIGTRGSNWNRLIDELRCVWVDKCPNIYIEVGNLTIGTYSW